MDLDELSRSLHARFDTKTAAREKALPASRRSIRASANAIRAVHRLELDLARKLIAESRAAIDEGLTAVAQEPDVRYAGFLQDAQKEYAEANLTYWLVSRASVSGEGLPTPGSLGVEDAPFLNGMAETVGEARRHVLDLLRTGDVARGEAILRDMEDMYGMLVTIDYPDAITLNLRRSTDVARSLDREDPRGSVDRFRATGRARRTRSPCARRLGPRVMPPLLGLRSSLGV